MSGSLLGANPDSDFTALISVRTDSICHSRKIVNVQFTVYKSINRLHPSPMALVEAYLSRRTRRSVEQRNMFLDTHFQFINQLNSVDLSQRKHGG